MTSPIPHSTPASPAHPLARAHRNLLILGLGAMLIAGVTTGIELWVYRHSGDIYLDRSRPGFLPDASEAAEEEKSTPSSAYSFSENGPLTASELDEYLSELQLVQTRIDELANPYSPTPLSNSSLGITGAPQQK